MPAVGLISWLIATYVSLQNPALLAEVRKGIAELENRIIARTNNSYVRAGECHLREKLVYEEINALMAGVHKAERHRIVKPGGGLLFASVTPSSRASSATRNSSASLCSVLSPSARSWFRGSGRSNLSR